MARVLRRKCHPLRQAWHVGENNDLTRAKQRDVPGGETVQEAQRSWVTVVEAAVAGALATDIYNDVKAAGKTVVDKIRKPPPGPSSDMSQGGGGGDAGPEAGRSS